MTERRRIALAAGLLAFQIVVAVVWLWQHGLNWAPILLLIASCLQMIVLASAIEHSRQPVSPPPDE
jgi:hypothetical protein